MDKFGPQIAIAWQASVIYRLRLADTGVKKYFSFDRSPMGE
jgi:hypothetical protein